MNDARLNCAATQDLLPSYVEGLTRPETNRLVEAHLAGCPACTAALAEMRGDPMPAPVPAAGAQPEPGLQYMRKVRRRHAVTIAGVVVAVMLMTALAASVLLTNVYGNQPLKPEHIRQLEVYQLADGAVYLRLDIDRRYTINSSWYDGGAQANGGYRVETAFAFARKTLFDSQPHSTTHLLVDSTQVSEVVLKVHGSAGELVLWRRGDDIPAAPEGLAALNEAAGYAAPWIGPFSPALEEALAG